MNASVVTVGAVAAGLAGLLAVELWPGQSAEQPPPSAPGAAVATASAAPDRPNTQALVDILLARPLFSYGRRPPNVAGGLADSAGGTPLPRMTAIVIDGTHRSALFVSPGGKPVSVGVGGRLGEFTVQAIEPQGVVVLGPDGSRVVRTSFDPNPPPPASPALVPPMFPGIGLPGQPPGPRPPPSIPPALPAGPGAAR